MSLKVWLPLNGDLHNQGYSNIDITNSNCTVNDAGKIGKCYYFNGSSYLSAPSPENIKSVCFWLKTTVAASKVAFVDYKSKLGFGFNASKYMIVSSDGWNIKMYTNFSAIVDNQWAHITLVKTDDGNDVLLYINGILQTARSSTNNWTHTTDTLMIGKRSSGTNMTCYINDFRAYDHCLSAAEVREISQGLVLHYKLDNITNEIIDSSGYNHHAISNGSQPITIDSDTPKYSYSTKFVAGSRIAMPVASSTCLPTDAITVSIWYKSSTGTNRFLSCTESGGWNFEVNSSKCSFPFYIKGKGYGRVRATKNFFSDNQWHMLTASYDGVSTAKIYLDGVLDNTSTITSGWENLPIAYNSSTPLTLGAEAQTIASPIAGTYVGNLSDLRIYCTAIGDDAVRQLYQMGAKIDNKHDIHAFEFNENDQNKVTKYGQVQGSLISEFEGMSYLKYDPNLYIEPDGSCWVRIYHHNNPGAGSFSSSNDFAHSVYIDENRWFNVEVCNYVNRWEFMIKGKYTSTGNEWKLRFIQNVNPMTAAYADVASSKVTKITGNGYSSYLNAWGGLYAKKSSAYLTTNNGNSGNWWGAVGSYSVYQNGIPGWGPSNTVTTTGYNDLYLRIDNVDFSTPIAKSTKNKIWTGRQIIEL